MGMSCVEKQKGMKVSCKVFKLLMMENIMLNNYTKLVCVIFLH